MGGGGGGVLATQCPRSAGSRGWEWKGFDAGEGAGSVQRHLGKRAEPYCNSIAVR